MELSKHSTTRSKSRNIGVNASRRNKDKRNSNPTDVAVLDSIRWRQAEQVEASMQLALEAMNSKPLGGNTPLVSFPAVRDCNAAMATFADGGIFLRALGLFLKMRKAATMTPTGELSTWNVPVPTLVTYSTLMSRAVQGGKERLALRLWYLMKTQPHFFSSSHRKKTGRSVILPDVKAANILMNVHAKLCDVETAKYLMEQMIYGNGTDVPRLEPNIVTYNSLLDACRRAGDLDAALEAKKQLDDSGLTPDARTFTTLIATVGRKASATSGTKDPSLAFAFLSEMIDLGIRPNGMTYSALIDVCARCGRTDMALKGLRAMLRQKSKEKGQMRTGGEQDCMYNEVGAWTSAINALGKAGRVETAMRLFQSMPKTGVQPNTITCGCLADSLLRHGRTADTLSVLRYMKQEGITPSEVMYTSLMTSAGHMAEIEKKQRWSGMGVDEDLLAGGGDAKAIEVYTALMKTLTEDTAVKYDENSQLLKVFLVFQEMKTAGTEPDLACYNALLRACSRAGDVNRAMDVLRKIKQDSLIPNNTSWREALKAAEKARRSDLADEIWRIGLEFHREQKGATAWKPAGDSLAPLISSYLREASDNRDDPEVQVLMYKKVVMIYKDIMTGSAKRRIEKEDLLGNTRALGMIIRAIVSLDLLHPVDAPKIVLRRVAVSIAALEVWKSEGRTDTPTWKALQIAERWRTELHRYNSAT
ncbi:Pentacotripeptide-repeat region of PRORP [Fragilaria crotonensis]|nr:Pentacotripeptide-repeat region of PRORP [Fragilaria crotonensis]